MYIFRWEFRIGLLGLRPQSRPVTLPHFNKFVQALVDAPLVAAEMAVGLQPPSDTGQRLALINLRFVDPIYLGIIYLTETSTSSFAVSTCYSTPKHH